MPDSQPIVWCLLGKKAGDNTQVRALAAALAGMMDVTLEDKHIVAQPWELLTHLTLKITLVGIDTAASSALQPPWPDLVITAGRRNEPVARWIQQQSDGKTRLVHLGRPWAPLDAWDLIITTPQYFLPQQANVLHNTLPLLDSAQDHASASVEHWRRQWEALPRPWIALLVGGDSGRYVLTSDKGARLGALADQQAAAAGGSLLITDSPRTPLAAADALQGAITVPHFFHRCATADSANNHNNPYPALLALADAFIVTGESMSMLAEAADTGRPLAIFDPGDGDTPWWKLPHAWRYKPLSFRAAMRFGPARMRRDIGRIQDALVHSGRAHWLQSQGLQSQGLQSEGLQSGGVQAHGDDGIAAGLQQQGLRTAEAAPRETSAAALELVRSAEALRQLLIPR